MPEGKIEKNDNVNYSTQMTTKACNTFSKLGFNQILLKIQWANRKSEALTYLKDNNQLNIMPESEPKSNSSH